MRARVEKVDFLIWNKPKDPCIGTGNAGYKSYHVHQTPTISDIKKGNVMK